MNINTNHQRNLEQNTTSDPAVVASSNAHELTMLGRFQAQHQLKIDSALTEHWDFDVRRHGDKNIKLQIALAKRTATTLEKAVTSFSNIRQTQELKLKGAAQAMRQLASELKPMVPWAQQYKAFCDAMYKKEQSERLESFSSQRWGNDDDAMRFEAAVVMELVTSLGQQKFALWVKDQGQYADIDLRNISCCIYSMGSGATLRERLAEALMLHKNAREYRSSSFGVTTVTCSWDTYESYLAYRKSANQSPVIGPASGSTK